jgi:hypothetical protein
LEDTLLSENKSNVGFTDWLIWMTYPIWWVMFHAFCCCLFTKSSNKDGDANFDKDQDSANNGVMAKLKKHLKKRKNKDEFKAINAMVQLLKNSPTAFTLLEKIRVNPQLNRL